jgi:hypothetical protein
MGDPVGCGYGSETEIVVSTLGRVIFFGQPVLAISPLTALEGLGTIILVMFRRFHVSHLEDCGSIRCLSHLFIALLSCHNLREVLDFTDSETQNSLQSEYSQL